MTEWLIAFCWKQISLLCELSRMGWVEIPGKSALSESIICNPTVYSVSYVLEILLEEACASLITFM